MTRSTLMAATALLAVACIDGTPIDDTGETGDTAVDFYDGPLQIQTIADFYCDNNDTVATDGSVDGTTGGDAAHDDDEWNIEVETDGWAGLIELDIYESGTGQSDACGTNDKVCEFHQLDNNVDFDPNGSYDIWQLDLERINTFGAYTPGEPCGEGQTTGCTGPAGDETATTFFSCWWADSSYDASESDFEGGSLAFRLTMVDTDGNDVDCAYFGYRSEQVFGDGGPEEHPTLDCICFEGSGDCTN